MHELKELLKDKGAEMLARQVDIGVIQRVSVAELFQLAEQLESAPKRRWICYVILWRRSVKNSARRRYS